METILVGFSRPTKWKAFSWIIMKVYGIDYSHVYVKLYSQKYQRNLIYQASQTMVNFMGDSEFLKHNEIVEEFPIQITNENKIKLMQFAIDNAGKPYGILQAVGLGIVRLAEILGKQISNPFKSEGATYVCSVLGGYILESFADIDVPGDYEDISPIKLREYLTLLKANGQLIY